MEEGGDVALFFSVSARLGCPKIRTTLSPSITLCLVGSHQLCGDSGDQGGELPWGMCSPPVRGPCSVRLTPILGGCQWRYGESRVLGGHQQPYGSPGLGAQPLVPGDPRVLQEEPPRQPLPLQGHRLPPQELLEAHERQMAAIQARTRELERQREGGPWQGSGAMEMQWGMR